MRRLPRATAGVLAARHPRLAGGLRRAAAGRRPGDRTVTRCRGAHRPLRAGAGDSRLAASGGAARHSRGDACGHDRDAVARKGLRHRRGLCGGRASARTAARVPHPGPVGGAVAGTAAVAHFDDGRVRGRRPRRAPRRRTPRRALVSRAVARDLDLHAVGCAGDRLADRGVGPRRACRAPRRSRRHSRCCDGTPPPRRGTTRCLAAAPLARCSRPGRGRSGSRRLCRALSRAPRRRRPRIKRESGPRSTRGIGSPRRRRAAPTCRSRISCARECCAAAPRRARRSSHAQCSPMSNSRDTLSASSSPSVRRRTRGRARRNSRRRPPGA